MCVRGSADLSVKGQGLKLTYKQLVGAIQINFKEQCGSTLVPHDQAGYRTWYKRV